MNRNGRKIALGLTVIVLGAGVLLKVIPPETDIDINDRHSINIDGSLVTNPMDMSERRLLRGENGFVLDPLSPTDRVPIMDPKAAEWALVGEPQPSAFENSSGPVNPRFIPVSNVDSHPPKNSSAPTGSEIGSPSPQGPIPLTPAGTTQSPGGGSSQPTPPTVGAGGGSGAGGSTPPLSAVPTPPDQSGGPTEPPIGQPSTPDAPTGPSIDLPKAPPISPAIPENNPIDPLPGLPTDPTTSVGGPTARSVPEGCGSFIYLIVALVPLMVGAKSRFLRLTLDAV